MVYFKEALFNIRIFCSVEGLKENPLLSTTSDTCETMSEKLHKVESTRIVPLLPLMESCIHPLLRSLRVE